MLEKKIDWVGRDLFFFLFFFTFCIQNCTKVAKYTWTRHNNSLKILPSLFDFPWFDVSKSIDRMTNSVHPDQTTSIGTVFFSGSILFAQTNLSKYVE